MFARLQTRLAFLSWDYCYYKTHGRTSTNRSVTFEMFESTLLSVEIKIER
jgi:hypothetical protein